MIPLLSHATIEGVSGCRYLSDHYDEVHYSSYSGSRLPERSLVWRSEVVDYVWGGHSSDLDYRFSYSEAGGGSGYFLPQSYPTPVGASYEGLPGGDTTLNPVLRALT